MDVRAAKWRGTSEERFNSATDLFQKRGKNYLVTFFLSYPPESRVHATLTEYENVSQNTIYRGIAACIICTASFNNTVFAGGEVVDTFKV